MKYKFPIILACCFVLIGLMINSCKKSNQDYIATLITGNQWQLSSVTVTHYTGANIDSVNTLDTACKSTQVFKFNIDQTCTYTNFDCVPQTATGHWALTQDKLFFNSDMICQDTSQNKSSKPFQTAKIINLGQYSLILQTGDLQTFYKPTDKRNVRQYGFVRVKSQ